MALTGSFWLNAGMLPIALCGNPLDRAHLKRRDAAWLAAARRSDEARLVLFSEGKPLICDGAAPILTARGLAALGGPEEQGLFLGIEGESPYFTLDIRAPSPAIAALGEFTDFRMALGRLPGPDAAILAEARGLLGWHARHGFCANCGAASEIAEGGWKRICPSCEAEHFPRTDPVVIMLAIRGDRVLLGRKAMFPPGMFSALAGFMEPGETIEEAVAREVKEETGVTVGAVRYLGSQPWPFPASLMIGCFAEARSETIAVDRTELDDARWFTREEIKAALASKTGEGALSAPPPFAIAHQLMCAWAAEG